MAHEFGATNEPDTCLWCGRKLRTNYTRGDVIEGPRKSVKGRDGHDDYTVPTYKRINKKATGKGLMDEGFFCTVTCATFFGSTVARLGERLRPREKGKSWT